MLPNYQLWLPGLLRGLTVYVLFWFQVFPTLFYDTLENLFLPGLGTILWKRLSYISDKSGSSLTQNCYVLISKKALLFWAAEFSIPLLLSRNEAAWDPQSWTVTNAQMLGPAPWCCWGPHTHILICLLLLEQGNNKCDKPSGLTYIWRNHLTNE